MRFVRRWVLLLTLLLPTILDAQSRGVRLQYGVLLARPGWEDGAAEVFGENSTFRPGLGIVTGLDYDVGRLGLGIEGSMAGIDTGPIRERNGIGIGRESGILRTLTLLASWSLKQEFKRRGPVVSLGYVKQSVDNVCVDPEQLPAFIRDQLPADIEEGAARVAGDGFRIGAATERSLPGSGLSGELWLRLEAAGDLIGVREVSYGELDAAFPGSARGFTPRLGAVLQWLPGR